MIKLGYARISIEEREKGQSLEQQSSRLFDAGADRVIQEIASRTDNDREGLTECLNLIKAGEVHTFIFTRIDRLTASSAKWEQLLELTQDNNVKVEALDSYIGEDIGTQFSNAIEVLVARTEVMRTRERVKRGIQYRHKLKRPNTPPFGYRINQKGDAYERDNIPLLCLISIDDKMLPELFVVKKKKFSHLSLDDINDFNQSFHEYSNDDIQLTPYQIGLWIILKYCQTKSINATDRWLHETFGLVHNVKINKKQSFNIVDKSIGLNSTKRNRRKTIEERINFPASTLNSNPARVREWLRNPVLNGYTRYNYRGKKGGKLKVNDSSEWEIYETHLDERMVDDGLWKHIHLIMDRNSKKGGWGHSTKINHPLSGLLKCQLCGSSYKIRGKQVYRKTKKVKYYYACNKAIQHGCSNTLSIMSYDMIDKIINEIIKQGELMKYKVDIELNAEQVIEDKILNGLIEQRQILLNMNSPYVQDSIRQIEKEIQSRQIELSQPIENDEIHDMITTYGCTKDFWYSLSEEEMTEMFHWLIKSVIVQEGDIIKVNWRF